MCVEFTYNPSILKTEASGYLDIWDFKDNLVYEVSSTTARMLDREAL